MRERDKEEEKTRAGLLSHLPHSQISPSASSRPLALSRAEASALGPTVFLWSPWVPGPCKWLLVWLRNLEASWNHSHSSQPALVPHMEQDCLSKINMHINRNTICDLLCFTYHTWKFGAEESFGTLELKIGMNAQEKKRASSPAFTCWDLRWPHCTPGSLIQGWLEVGKVLVEDDDTVLGREVWLLHPTTFLSSAHSHIDPDGIHVQPHMSLGKQKRPYGTTGSRLPVTTFTARLLAGAHLCLPKVYPVGCLETVWLQGPSVSTSMSRPVAL